MNLLDRAEVSIDLPFLAVVTSAAKWQVNHGTAEVESCDVVNLGWISLAKMQKKGCER